MGTREVETSVIGEMVMDKLKDLNEVAYVRFAAIYREFKDVNTFMSELKKLLNTTPVPDVVEKPEIQDPTPAPLPSVPTKNGNGLYPYILSLSQAEKNFTDYKIYYTNTESEAPEKGPKEDGLNIHIQMVQTMRMIQRML